jgi:hypothetical protein
MVPAFPCGTAAQPDDHHVVQNVYQPAGSTADQDFGLAAWRIARMVDMPVIVEGAAYDERGSLSLWTGHCVEAFSRETGPLGGHRHRFLLTVRLYLKAACTLREVGRSASAGVGVDHRAKQHGVQMSTSNDITEAIEPASENRSLGAGPEVELGQHKANARRLCRWLGPVLGLISVGAFVTGILLAMSSDYNFAAAAFVVAVFFLISTIIAPALIVREGGIQEEEEKRCKEECGELITALDTITDPTISGLAKANFKQLRMFTVIALRQARMSYYASLVAASISLLVLACGAAVALGLADTSAKITAASLTTVGVALSGFLSATFLSTYRMAARQMSYYYGQPLVHCYLLHAEWLALTLAEHPERKVDADLWREAVKASIQAGENAQNHLLDLQDVNLNSRVRRHRRENGLYSTALADAAASDRGK